MKPDLLPHEVDALLSTHAPLNGDPTFVPPEHVQRHRDRHAALLHFTRNTYGTSLLAGLVIFLRQLLRIGVYAVALVFLFALLVSTLFPGGKP
ncbi:hypothetical protein ACFJIS_18900 [Variovorax boronicumulans]|uniref:hypothetical protein n=1 Tax=Variovorax boronicumulans TaxID=436515 RepID=UPI0036F256EC